MKKNVYIAIGLPSCGKSTWMEEHLKDVCHHGRNFYSVLDADQVCKDVNGDATNRSNFSWVSQVHYQRYVNLLRHRDYNHIGITNTSLTPAKRQQYWLLARMAKVDVAFTFVYFDISPEECIKRQKNRERKVPESVIWEMDKKMLFPDPQEFRNFGSNTRLIYVNENN